MGAGGTVGSFRFANLIYLKGERPIGGKGEAAFWLPLLGIFSGARLNELASVEDVKLDTASGVRFATVIEDEEAGRGVKTEHSLRAVPVHPELVRIGFLEFVEHVRAAGGLSARLFSPAHPESQGWLWRSVLEVVWSLQTGHWYH